MNNSIFDKMIADSIKSVYEALDSSVCTKKNNPGPGVSDKTITDSELLLITEEAIVKASKKGETSICCKKGAVVTPLAREKAEELGIVISVQNSL